MMQDMNFVPDVCVTVGLITEVVAERLELTPGDILSASRATRPVQARQIIYWLARKHTTLSFPQIGRAMHQDHSTVMSGVDRVEELLANNAPFKDYLTGSALHQVLIETGHTLEIAARALSYFQAVPDDIDPVAVAQRIAFAESNRSAISVSVMETRAMAARILNDEAQPIRLIFRRQGTPLPDDYITAVNALVAAETRLAATEHSQLAGIARLKRDKCARELIRVAALCKLTTLTRKDMIHG